MPGVLSALVTGDDVVDGELPGLSSTILTGVAVPPEDLFAQKLDLGSGTPDHVVEANHGGAREDGSGSMDPPPPVLDDLGLAQKDQHHSSLGVTHVQRFVILIEDQNGQAKGPSLAGFDASLHSGPL
jgi:hypothetical protein